MNNTVFETDIAGLDAVLNGGLSRNSLSIIIGPPGAGKTVLASQIIFEAARRGEQTIVFTSFSEGNEQYIEHMQVFSFFDQALIGDSVHLYSLTSMLEHDKEAPAIAIARAIRLRNAKVVMIDGFQGVANSLPDHNSRRELVAAIARQIRYLDAAVIFTFAGTVNDANVYVELTASDVGIGLHYALLGYRHQRHLEVIKQRGRPQLPGLHPYWLGTNGFRVIPRLEVYPVPEVQPRVDTRESFGLPELDQLIGGGLNTGTTTLIAGAPGVGKTLLALHWALTKAQPDATSLLITFAEYPEQLIRKAGAFGLDLEAAVANGLVEIVRVSPVDVDPDAVAEIIYSRITSGRISRVIVDDIVVLMAVLGERTRDYLAALSSILYGANITSLHLTEIKPFTGLRLDMLDTPIAILYENVIVIQQYEIHGELRRLLAVLRMRLSWFDRTLRELIIDPQGVRVLTPEQTTTAVLNTGAVLSGGTAPESAADA